MLKEKDIRVAGKYVRGLSHIDRNEPCQDRIYSKSSVWEGIEKSTVYNFNGMEMTTIIAKQKNMVFFI